MSDIEARMEILEHRMDNSEEQNRRLEDELVRSRMEVRDAFQRLGMRIDEMNQRMDHRFGETHRSIQETNRRIDETNQRMDHRFNENNRRIDQLQSNLSQQILELAVQTNRLHRWILAVALFIVTVLPITFKLADRWL